MVHFRDVLIIYLLVSILLKFPLQHKFIEKCNSGASKMLAKIKVAKKIRATLAVQNELSDPDNVCHIVCVMCVGYAISLDVSIYFGICRQRKMCLFE
jgi:hypothetical protein